MAVEDNLIAIGRIVGTYGVKGAVRVAPLTDFPERYRNMSSVLVVRGKQVSRLDIEWSRQHGANVLIKFKDLNAPEEALKWKGATLKVTPDEVYKLPEGTYYVFQLIGLQVYDEERGHLGRLSDVIETGANDVYVVTGGRFGEVLIPALKQVILRIDLEAGTMHVKLLPGLID